MKARQKKLPLYQSWDVKAVMTESPEPHFKTDLGYLFKGDCMQLLPLLKNESIDTVFADPPFNIGKLYGKSINDNLPEEHYIKWCEQWLAECVRITKQGGTIFVYNLPKWNILLGAFLTKAGMQFRHAIAINIKASLPIPGRLYPSHYSLLYFTKGKPKTFNKIRVPIEICRHCGKELKDYGGHRDAMNPLGVNLTDVWNDIPPVRHRKFKSSGRKANQLSTKILYRAIRMSTKAGDVVLDPFGGSGTTFAVSEQEGRRWIGFELGDCDPIVERLEGDHIAHHQTKDYVED